MSDWDRVKDLGLTIDDYTLERRQQSVSSDFERVTTVITLRGAGEEGVGEDVVYDAEDHDAALEQGATLPLAGSYTLETFSDALAGLDLFDSRRCARSRRCTARTPTSPPRSTSHCARPASRCTRRSGARRSRSPSSSRCASASRPRSSR
jgi:hypothetical protein